MPDLIDWGVDDFDQQAVREQITVLHPFDRVILLDPRDHTRAFEI
jgi:hypothetical protein